MTERRKFLLQATFLTGALLAGAAHAQQKEVTIAYQDMLVPWRVAQAAGELEKATGYKVNFRQFAGGGDVIRALASGQVHLGEAGSAPIAAGISQGLPVELFWILDDINNAEALVVRNGAGINALADLKGKRIGVPFTSTTHFHTLVALEHAGVAPNEVKVVNLRPPEIAAAWERGDIDATFVWEPVLSKVKANGRVLVSSGEIAHATGKTTFDGVVVNKDWAKENGEFLRKFTALLAAADARYRHEKAAWKLGTPEIDAIAKITGAKPEEVPAGLALYQFPTAAEQAGTRWLGGGPAGGAAKSLAATAAFLKSQGTIANVLPDYSVGVTPRYVEQVAR